MVDGNLRRCLWEAAVLFFSVPFAGVCGGTCAGSCVGAGAGAGGASFAGGVAAAVAAGRDPRVQNVAKKAASATKTKIDDFLSN